MAFCLYSIRNLVNGKGYIGQTTRVDPARRWREHQQAAVFKFEGLLHRAIRKYGAANFSFEPVLTFDSQEEINRAEVEMIAECNTQGSVGGWGYNIAPGGFGGGSGPVSEATRAKMKAAHSTPEARAKKSADHLGRKRPPEAVARMKAAQGTPDARENKRRTLTGIKRSAATIEKIRAVQADPEIKARLLQARHQFRLSPEHASKLRASAHTPTANAKRSAALLGRKLTVAHIANLKAARNSPEAQAKFSAATRGRKNAPEAIERMRVAARLTWARRKNGTQT